jgi:hypothetical protein
MELRSSYTRTLILAIFVALSGATAARARFSAERSPRPCIIEGYLASAPKGATLLDCMLASDRPKRGLLVHGTPRRFVFPFLVAG